MWCGAPEPPPCDGGSASSKPGVPEEAKDSKDSVPLSPQSGSRNVKEDKDGTPWGFTIETKRNGLDGFGWVWMGWMDCMGWVGFCWAILKMFFPMILRVCLNGEIDVKNCI